MTREEEAKEIFNSILDAKSQFDAYGIKSTEYNLKVNEKFFDGLEMAIKTLEQQIKIRDCKTCIHSKKRKCAYTEECHECMWESKYEQKPCEDVVNREDLEECKELMTDITGDTVYAVRMSDIRKLPPATPKPKMGRWIDDKCSVCGKGIEDLIDSREWYKNEELNFCPFCGIKIEEVEK